MAAEYYPGKCTGFMIYSLISYNDKKRVPPVPGILFFLSECCCMVLLLDPDPAEKALQKSCLQKE